MKSPPGWRELRQTPEFDECSVMPAGSLSVTTKAGVVDVAAGHAVIAHKGEWVQHSTLGGADYIAVYVPDFSPETVHRDPE